ncbi:hypothetical protein QUF70_08610 [Desulfobacterales bacterium HSG17]|nr:hypothetical protein [Desulfobacterales bacterium HSG17]
MVFVQALIRSDTDKGAVVILDRRYKVEKIDKSSKFSKKPDWDGSGIVDTVNEETAHEKETPPETESRVMIGYKNIVCFANSHKYNGSCIAGKQLVEKGDKDWIRPVSAKQMGEIYFSFDKSTNKEPFDLLDIISVPIRKPFPNKYQTENYLIDEGKKWIYKRSLSISELPEYYDNEETIWINGYHSFVGYNDRIPIDLAFSECTTSLMLIQPAKVTINVDFEGTNKKKVRAKFQYNGTNYSFIVTDKIIRKEYINKNVGEYSLNLKIVSFCISISEPWQDYCYKLVAGVIGNQG